jgi:hypothetical protein
MLDVLLEDVKLNEIILAFKANVRTFWRVSLENKNKIQFSFLNKQTKTAYKK